MKTLRPFHHLICISLILGAVICFGDATPAGAGTPQPNVYAALLAKARAGTLQINHGESEPATGGLFRGLTRSGATPTLPPEVFAGQYRKTAKTSFPSGTVKSFATLQALLATLLQDSQMTQQFPALVGKVDTARVAPERRMVKVSAWIYWAATENDRDFHIVLGSTREFTSTTVFMNSEVSGLSPEDPKRSPFPQRRATILGILKNHKNEHGLFLAPVAVSVTGALFWDGEHRFPNNVGPEGLRPVKAWEIHPIQLLAER